MLGSDEKVGVWMIVMVSARRSASISALNSIAPNSSKLTFFQVDREDLSGNLNRMTSPISDTARAYHGAASPKYSGGNKLYAEYLRREGRAGAGSGPSFPEKGSIYGSLRSEGPATLRSDRSIPERSIRSRSRAARSRDQDVRPSNDSYGIVEYR